MEDSDGAYPRDSLSHLIGKCLEEVLPGSGDKVSQHSTKSSGGKKTQTWAPWVSASKRGDDLRSVVRGSGSIAPVKFR
jgi:hypothetical protein